MAVLWQPTGHNRVPKREVEFDLFHHGNIDLQALDDPISEDETREVIKELHPDKAPGPAFLPYLLAHHKTRCHGGHRSDSRQRCTETTPGQLGIHDLNPEEGRSAHYGGLPAYKFGTQLRKANYKNPSKKTIAETE